MGIPGLQSAIGFGVDPSIRNLSTKGDTATDVPFLWVAAPIVGTNLTDPGDGQFV